MEVKLQELELGEKFKFQDQLYTVLKEIKTNEGYEYRIIDCKDEKGRHRPFREDTEVYRVVPKTEGFK